MPAFIIDSPSASALQAITRKMKSIGVSSKSKSSKSKAARCLQFNKEVKFQEIPARSHYSSHEVAEMWYTRAEYTRMKKADRSVLALYASSSSLITDAHDIRGLESRMPAMASQKRQVRYRATEAVLQEQHRQWVNNAPNAQAISDLYAQECRASVIVANATALKDAECALAGVFIKPGRKLTRQDAVVPSSLTSHDRVQSLRKHARGNRASSNALSSKSLVFGRNRASMA